MPERWILTAIVVGRTWKQRPRPLLSPEMHSQTPELDLLEAPGGLCRRPPSLYSWAFFLIFSPGFSITLSITVPRELRPPSPRGMSPMQAVLSRYFGMRVERTH